MNTTIKYYIIRERETGEIIEYLDTIEQAIKKVNDYEEEDKFDNLFTEDYYEIVEIIERTVTI